MIHSLSSAAVPEPNTLLLAVVIVLPLLGWFAIPWRSRPDFEGPPRFLTGSLTIAALLVCTGFARAQSTSTVRFIPLGDLDGGDFLSRPLEILADGSVVVGSSYSARGEEAFRWTEAEGMVPLGDLDPAA